MIVGWGGSGGVVVVVGGGGRLHLAHAIFSSYKSDTVAVVPVGPRVKAGLLTIQNGCCVWWRLNPSSQQHCICAHLHGTRPAVQKREMPKPEHYRGFDGSGASFHCSLLIAAAGAILLLLLLIMLEHLLAFMDNRSYCT